ARVRLASHGVAAAPARMAQAPQPRQVAAALPVTQAAPTRPLRASAAPPALAAEGEWQEF
ncbi:hypothetical protein AAGG40_21170, partial [Stenotrophomonas maltophilia]